MSRAQLLSACLGALLALPLAAQVQPDWRSTYEAPSLPAGGFDQVTAMAIAPGGDVFWASDHAWLDTTTQFWQLRTELHRTSPAGATLWTISPPPNFDVIYSKAFVDASGDVYFSGQAGRLYSNPDLLVTKVSPTGTVLWSKRINGPTNDYDVGIGCLDAAGHFSFVGTLDLFSTVFVETYDAAGNVLVHTTFSAYPLGIEWIRSVVPFPSGGFVLSATTPFGIGVVARLSASGQVLWSDLRGFQPGVETGSLSAIAVDANGRIAVAANEFNKNFECSSNYRVYDANGAVLLNLVDPFLDASSARHCRFAADGSLWFAATQRVTSGSPLELRARHLAADLSLIAIATVPLPGPTDSLWDTIPGSAGQLFLHLGADQLGELSWDGQFDWLAPLAAPGSFDSFTGLAFDSNHGLVAAGYHDNSNGAFTDLDTLLVRLDASGIPSNYGTGMVGALGCRPQLHHSGRASANGTGSFELAAFPWRNQVAGRFLVGTGPAIANPFFSGTIHVGVPRVRTPATSSGGSATGVADCSGVLTLDFDAWASGSLGGTLLPGLQTVGTTVRAQAWSRDPGAPGNTLLSDALEFTLLP